MLHIVNGDSVGERLKEANIEGDIVVWRDIYSFGPVFSDMAAEHNVSIRAHYLEQALAIPYVEYAQSIVTQQSVLSSLHKYNEIVLWFEHDLFDQAMLGYILHQLLQLPLGETKLQLLCIGEYPGIEPFHGLGQLTSKQLKSLYGAWSAIGKQELELGSKFWQAYTSTDIEKHIDFLHTDSSALPFAKAAFEAHLKRLPSTYNGLGIIEQVTLACVASGIHSPYPLFEQVSNQLQLLGMGDLEYWYYLNRMAQEPNPLIHVKGGVDGFPTYTHSVSTFDNYFITLTELGRNVLNGEEVWASLTVNDRWYGGLHIKGTDAKLHWDQHYKVE